MYRVTNKDSHAIQTMPDIPPETVQSQTQFHHSRQRLRRYKEKIKIQSVKLIGCLKMIPNRNFGAHSSGEPPPDKSPMWTHGITASLSSLPLGHFVLLQNLVSALFSAHPVTLVLEDDRGCRVSCRTEVSGELYIYRCNVPRIEWSAPALRDDSKSPCPVFLMEKDAEPWKNTDSYCTDNNVPLNIYCISVKASKEILCD